MIAVRLQFAQSSVREAARRGKGGLGNFIRLPELQQLAGGQEPGAKSVCVTAAGESRGGRHAVAEQVAAADTLYIYRGESNQHLPTPRPGAETDCQPSSVLRRHGHIRTLSYSSCRPAEAGGWSWRLRRLIAAVMREPRPWLVISAGGELFNETLISISRLR